MSHVTCEWVIYGSCFIWIIELTISIVLWLWVSMNESCQMRMSHVWFMSHMNYRADYLNLCYPFQRSSFPSLSLFGWFMYESCHKWIMELTIESVSAVSINYSAWFFFPGFFFGSQGLLATQYDPKMNYKADCLNSCQPINKLESGFFSRTFLLDHKVCSLRNII